MSHRVDSDSESSSLEEEFESADEDVKGEDIDLAELGLDDDDEEDVALNEKPTQPEAGSKVKEPLHESKEPVESEVKPTDRELNQNKQEEIVAPAIEQTKHEEHLDLVEGDDEIDQLLDEMNIHEEKKENKEPLTPQKVEESTEVSTVEAKVTEAKNTEAKSGWDDTELSDIDDEELVSNVPLSAQIETKNEIKKEPTTQTAEPVKQSGWSWSSFGSMVSNATSSVANVASQLGTGLNTVLETVEQTIGILFLINLKKFKYKYFKLNES